MRFDLFLSDYIEHAIIEGAKAYAKDGGIDISTPVVLATAGKP